MEYVLARQIDYQHFLLHREARRNERRMRRAKRDDKVQAMEAGTGPTIIVNATAPKSKRRSATSAPPPKVNAVKPDKRSKSRDAKREKEAKLAQAKVDKQQAKRRSRSSAPQVQMGADPGGKVRHWILQQSDFMPSGKNEKS